MSTDIALKGFHHLTLTVTDINRACEFYTGVLGLNVVTELSPERVIVGNDHLFFGLGKASDPARSVKNDRFDENRVGLDHLSFSVDSREDLERAQQLFDERGVRHAEMKDLPDFGITVMMFWDPDNIQLELTAPLK